MLSKRSILAVVILIVLFPACFEAGEVAAPQPPSSRSESPNTTEIGSVSTRAKPVRVPVWPKIPREARLLPLYVWFVDSRVGFGSERECTRPYDSGRFFSVKCTLMTFRSDSGGATWRSTGEPGRFIHRHHQRQQLSEIGYPSSVYFADERHGWVYGGATYRTDDGGATWRIERGLPSTAQTMTGKDGSVWAVINECDWLGCDSRLWTFNLSTRRWAATPAQPSCYGSLAVVNSNTAFMSCEDVSVTMDGGQTWTARQSPCSEQDYGPGDIAARSITELWVVCHDEGSTGGQGLTLFHSLDAAESWSVASEAHECCDREHVGNPPISGHAGDLLVTPDGVFVSRSKFGSVSRSYDGTNWENVLRNVDLSFGLQAVDDLHLWAWTANDCCLYRTTDGGESWDVLAIGPSVPRAYRAKLERADV